MWEAWSVPVFLKIAPKSQMQNEKAVIILKQKAYTFTLC